MPLRSPVIRRVPGRPIALLSSVLAILWLAGKPDATRDATAYLRGDPGAFLLEVSITPPTGDGWNPGFELRSVLLHARPIPLEPAALWPSGNPVSTDAPISEGDAARLIPALVRLEFFERAAREPPGSSPTEGRDLPQAHCQISVSGPVEGEPAWRARLRDLTPPLLGTALIPARSPGPRRYRATYPWDQHLLPRLRRLRGAARGDAGRELDKLIGQLPSVPR